jgi:hypothetical protein
MKYKTPTSLIIFIINWLLSVGVIIATIPFHQLKWDKKYLIYLGFAQSLVTMLAPLGVYSGIKFRLNIQASRKSNQLGLWGNILLLSYTVGIMIYALIF